MVTELQVPQCFLCKHGIFNFGVDFQANCLFHHISVYFNGSEAISDPPPPSPLWLRLLLKTDL